jgi:pullulanase
MGLIDLETMTQITQELHKIDSNILVYGEPWSAGETSTSITDKGKQRSRGFSVFNDNFRDSLKGSVFQPRERGYIQTGINIEKVKIGILGSIQDFADNPQESLNYVECHDNHTLWDRLVISTIDDSNLTEADRRAMARLGAAILLTSQGIPFFQSGQEFLRSKAGNENSYNKPDAVNML